MNLVCIRREVVTVVFFPFVQLKQSLHVPGTKMLSAVMCLCLWSFGPHGVDLVKWSIELSTRLQTNTMEG